MESQDFLSGTSASVGDLLKRCRDVLQDANIDSASIEASLLICHVLEINKAQLYSYSERMVEYGKLLILEKLIKKRCNGYPLAYLIGEKEFYGLSFFVSEGVLIPRPETEHIIEEAIKELSNKKTVIMDLGTGSGCIAVSLAKHLPQSKLIAVDISLKALNIANSNAHRHGVKDRIDFLEMDMMDALKVYSGKLDAVVSNPPYIPTEDIKSLQIEVRDYEPLIALDGGTDGFDFYRNLIPLSYNALNKDGVLIIEIGIYQAEEIYNIALQSGFKKIRICKDLSGIDRTLVCNK